MNRQPFVPEPEGAPETNVDRLPKDSTVTLSRQCSKADTAEAMNLILKARLKEIGTL
jgi:hypothetical protein